MIASSPTCSPSPPRKPTPAPYSRLWLAALPDFHNEPDKILRREMLWNAYVLQAFTTGSQYFHETYVPQGSVLPYTKATTPYIRKSGEERGPI